MAKININTLKPKSPVHVEIPADIRELDAVKKMNEGMAPASAVVAAGYSMPPSTAAKFGESLREKYNSRMVGAYEMIGLTPEYLAEKQKEMIDSDKVRPADKLKAIDQVLNVVGGFAPKQIDVAQVTFEQTVIQLANTVNAARMSMSDVRSLLAEDAEFTDVPQE